jgi:hypothetical protein
MSYGSAEYRRTGMKTVQEIEAAIKRLSLSERAQLAKWFNGWKDDAWDQEMIKDFGPGGRYERVPERVRAEISRTPLKDLA